MSLETALWLAIPGLIFVGGLAFWLSLKKPHDLDDDEWWL